jgi:hypothetical protein
MQFGRLAGGFEFVGLSSLKEGGKVAGIQWEQWTCPPISKTINMMMDQHKAMDSGQTAVNIGRSGHRLKLLQEDFPQVLKSLVAGVSK